MALMAIAQHHGRPGVPQDQAWIESFFGHIKTEWPHLEAIADPSLLEAELIRVGGKPVLVGRPGGVGSSPPGAAPPARGDPPRQPRRDGPDRPLQRRLDHHRRTTPTPAEEMP